MTSDAKKKTVMAIVAHPDDIEFTMAGTMLLLKDRGWDVHYMTIANGAWGSTVMRRDEIVATRAAEARAGAESIGATFHASIVDDVDILYERQTLLRVIAALREADPDVVLCQSLSDYMEDHQNATRLAVSAAFCRCMPNAPVDPPTPATFKDVAVYHAAPHGNRDAMRKLVRSERYVDISSVLARKRAALACHKSQKEWLDVSQGYDSYLNSMEQAAALVGKLSGKYEYAEGWRRHSSLGFSASEDFDPLGEALADVSWLDPKYQEWLDS